MGQRVYVLSQFEYSNILGIFTNIRQCRKFILKLENQDNILLHEIRMNEPEKERKDMTKLLNNNISSNSKINKSNSEINNSS
jgi:predicted MarR family transcription regulator